MQLRPDVAHDTGRRRSPSRFVSARFRLRRQPRFNGAAAGLAVWAAGRRCRWLGRLRLHHAGQAQEPLQLGGGRGRLAGAAVQRGSLPARHPLPGQGRAGWVDGWEPPRTLSTARASELFAEILEHVQSGDDGYWLGEMPPPPPPIPSDL